MGEIQKKDKDGAWKKVGTTKEPIKKRSDGRNDEVGVRQRKIDGEWVVVGEDGKPVEEPEQSTSKARDEELVAEAKVLLDEFDYKDARTFLAEHSEEGAPSGSDKVKAALEAFIEGGD